MKRFAAVLLVAVILFVVLILIPQLRQPHLATPAVQASVGAAVNASDLLGSWTTDGEATWEMTRTQPLMAQRLASLSPETAEQFKSLWLANIASNSYLFTAEKLISVVNGVRYEASYAITAISGSILTADCVGEKGQAYQLKLAAAKDRLEMASPANPDFYNVLKRLR
jgi:hypothetical protein